MMDFLNKNINKPAAFIQICRRLIDYSLFYLILNALSQFLPGIFSEFSQILLVVMLIILFAPVEALFLSTWGRTPGMFLCGITLRDVLGKKLTFRKAFKWALFLERRKNEVVAEQKKGKVLGIIASLICLMGVFTASGLKDSLLQTHETINGWVHYTSKEAGFSADFPAKPTQEQKVLEITSVRRNLNYDEFMARSNENVVYSISYIELPKKWGVFSSSTLLKGALTVITESSFEAKLASKSLTSFMHHPALNFHIKEGENEIKGRLVLVGTTLYKLSVTYNPSQTTQDTDLNIDQFLNSFDHKSIKGLIP